MKTTVRMTSMSVSETLLMALRIRSDRS